MFERGGHAGMLFRYHGPDTGNRWAVVRAAGRRVRNYPITYRHGLFMENAFYFGQGGRCQNLKVADRTLLAGNMSEPCFEIDCQACVGNIDLSLATAVVILFVPH